MDKIVQNGNICVDSQVIKQFILEGTDHALQNILVYQC